MGKANLPKQISQDLGLGVGKKGFPVLSCKRKTIHHGGRGKQYLINSSAALVPQEFNNRTQELIDPEENTKVT